MNPPHPPKRLLVVLPSWLGDVVMATPALQVLRDALPGALIGALMRPGVDAILDGTSFFDETHVDHAAGMMGPKRVATKLRLQRYDAAVLFTNSFSTALITRLASIPWRLGYARDGRGALLTDKLQALRRRDIAPFDQSTTNPAAWAPVPACDYYMRLAHHLCASIDAQPIDTPPLRLVVTDKDDSIADDILRRAGVAPDARCIMLNPGANNPAKRWPAERFAQLADLLARQHGATLLLNGSPAERELVHAIAEQTSTDTPTISLPDHAMPLPALKPLIRRSALLVTNDTGPRHIAAALGTPCVGLFGPTDRRWTTLPVNTERELVADPTLPECEVANDHPERCAIEHISFEDVAHACAELLASAAHA